MNDERKTRVMTALGALIDAFFGEETKASDAPAKEPSEPKQRRKTKEEKPAKPAKPAKDEEVEDLELEDEDDDDVVNGEDEQLTLEDAREVLHAVIKKRGPDAGRELLKKFKLKKVSDLSENKIAEFVSACEEIVD